MDYKRICKFYFRFLYARSSWHTHTKPMSQSDERKPRRRPFLTMTEKLRLAAWQQWKCARCQKLLPASMAGDHVSSVPLHRKLSVQNRIVHVDPSAAARWSAFAGKLADPVPELPRGKEHR